MKKFFLPCYLKFSWKKFSVILSAKKTMHSYIYLSPLPLSPSVFLYPLSYSRHEFFLEGACKASSICSFFLKASEDCRIYGFTHSNATMVTFLYFIFTESDDRVRLTDVSTLTLVKGQYTTGRRSAPVLQLQCVGGSAKGRYEPRVHFFNLAIWSFSLFRWAREKTIWSKEAWIAWPSL